MISQVPACQIEGFAASLCHLSLTEHCWVFDFLSDKTRFEDASLGCKISF